jgi:hypothetical protein
VAKPNGFTHAFPAIRGTQAGRAFYIAMCPLKIIPKIFVFDEAEVPPELRAQRTLNRARIPEIATYLIENSDRSNFPLPQLADQPRIWERSTSPWMPEFSSTTVSTDELQSKKL